MGIKVKITSKPSTISSTTSISKGQNFKSTEVAVGRKGDRGDDGVNGINGLDGLSAYEIALINGFVGTESEWLSSLKGEKGDVGERGLQGEVGLQGIKGDSGNDGSDGLNGYTPIKGIDYFDGQQGLNGQDGYNPIKGVDYFDGIQGIKGDAGERGLQGERGSDGTNGINGQDGYTPIKGVDYFDGVKGDKGYIGLTGEQGIQGIQGVAGANGSNGSDANVTKENVEAVLTGEISSHSHVGGGLSTTATYPSVPTPLPPAEDNITLFARNRAGRMMLNTIGASGIDTALQNALFGNNIYMWLPSNTTTVSIGFGTLWTARNTTGAQATPAKATTNILTNMSRATFSSTTAVNTGAGIQSATTTVCRGNNNAYGGFFFFTRFGMETISGTGQQVFIGLNTLNGALAGEPSLLANSIGIGKDSTDTNWFIQSRNASAVTRLDTGVAIVTGQVYDFMMFCKPNDTKVTVRLVRLSDNAVLLDNVEITGTLPVNTTYMYACAHLRNTGLAVNQLALNRIYVETDI